MGRLQQIFNNWKAEYNTRQKTNRFVQALHHVPGLVSTPIAIEGEEINFSHSGHAGDIIYAIPAMRELAQNRKINLYLQLNQPNRDFTKSMRHPNGKVMLTEKSVALFEPLFMTQPGFAKCEAHAGQPIHYDLAAFRSFPFDYRMGSIARWYFLTFGISRDLGQPWLTVPPNHQFNNAIVLARSSRNHTPGID